MLLANDMICKKWNPKFYPDKLTLFCSSETTNIEIVWHDRVHELETHFAAGGHIDLIEWPYVTSLATDISACLTKASAATTPAA
jgi:hypothetical protein